MPVWLQATRYCSGDLRASKSTKWIDETQPSQTLGVEDYIPIGYGSFLGSTIKDAYFFKGSYLKSGGDFTMVPIRFPKSNSIIFHPIKIPMYSG